MPLLAGCGTNSLDGTLANMELLEPFGPDAWLVVVPYYNKPTQEGQYRYFRAVAERSTLPIVIYNVPGRTGANMEASTAIRLAEDFPNIIGIKEASGRYDQVSELIRRAPEGFSVLSGDDDMTLALMATGGQGVISVASNVAPAEVSAMCDALLKDFAREYAGRHGLRVYSINDTYPRLWADRNFSSAGPREFLSLVYNCDAFVSNSFHGTAFSIIFHKPAFVFNRHRHKVNSRMQSLMGLFGLEGCIIGGKAEFARAMDVAVDWAAVDGVMERELRKSKDFIGGLL